jgi:GntR family transcriptional regulator / MocR family aminotransferase
MGRSQTNLAWDTLLRLDTAASGPLHARLAAALRAAIRDGRLPAGSALPPSRLLATSLGCSRWAATEAYEQLVAEGYLHARVGAGTWVSESAIPAAAPPTRAARPAPPAAIDLAPGLPDLRAFPMRQWLAAQRTAVAALPYHALGYPDRSGDPRLRTLLAAYLARVRGAAASADDVLVCTGVTDAVLRICAALVSQGGAVAVEDPGWTRLREAIAGTGVPVVPVPVDEQGIRVDALRRLSGVRAVVVSPAHQFPTGAVLSAPRRAALLDWARRVDGLIVEDDYDAEFRYDRRPVGTVQGTDPSRVALAGSLSKTLAPALRLGWLVLPPRWVRAVRDANPAASAPSTLDQLSFAAFLESGGYDRHLRACRQRYRGRRDALLAALTTALPGVRVGGAAAGLHLLVRPPGRLDGPDTVRRAADLGLRVACVAQYRVNPRPREGTLVLGYGNLTDAQIPAAVSRLVTAVR